jgi:hypothetical protein
MYPYGVDKKSPAAAIPALLPVAVRHRLGFHPAPIALSRVNRPDVSEDETYVLFDLRRLPGGVRGWSLA